MCPCARRITPQAEGEIYWTMVLIDTIASGLAKSKPASERIGRLCLWRLASITPRYGWYVADAETRVIGTDSRVEAA